MIAKIAGALPFQQGALFWKYVLLIVAVTGASLLASSLLNILFTYREHRAELIRFQTEQASSAASKISQFIKEIESQLGWTTHLSWSTSAIEQRELDGLRLLRQVPAIYEIAMLDDDGQEQLRLSRQAMNAIGSKVDYSKSEQFVGAVANRTYYGPAYFRRETEPYMTLAVAGVRRDTGVSVAEVNLKHIWDVIHQIRVGQNGRAFVVDAQGRLIAHPDLSLVLRNTDLSTLPQVRSARVGARSMDASPMDVSFNVYGERVLTAYARADPLNWLVFVELPEQEANAPLYAAMSYTALVMLGGFAMATLAALLFAKRMMMPIKALTAGAERIGAGVLDHRISIETGDELQALGTQFNHMAADLQASYATLEGKVEERTQQLQAANQSKSRFLAVASHDLRQPLHALNLLVAQLQNETRQAERQRIAGRIDAAVANMNELFNALLDISKLDAGSMTPTLSNFPIADILTRLEAMFGAAAREKGLHFSVVMSRAIVCSDAILLERLLLNLVSNAVRYTERGGIVVGCRRQAGRLRIDVCDSGVGIAEAQQKSIFTEFYRVASSSRDQADAMGLGLSIVERLSALLDHPISLVSKVGVGSRFSASVPIAAASTQVSVPIAIAAREQLRGKLVVVIDDDRLVREGTGGLLESWGCSVVTAASPEGATEQLDGRTPDLIVTDFHLQYGSTGIEVIEALRKVCGRHIPAVIISGDVAPERLREAESNGFHLLHKPVTPSALRAITGALVRQAAPPEVQAVQ
jgi:signal transduction histidine kinase